MDVFSSKNVTKLNQLTFYTPCPAYARVRCEMLH